MRRSLLVAGFLAFGAVSLPALAQDEPPSRPPVRAARPEGAPRTAGQPPRRGVQLSPEEAEAAWKVEAIGAAKHAGADDAKAGEVAKAYISARKSHDAAIDKLREERRAGGGGGGGGQDFLASMQDLAKTEREKLNTSVSAILSADQSAKVMKSLGTFFRQWDHIAHTIAGFGLDSAKQQEALNAVEDYVVTQSAAMTQRGPDTDRDAVAKSMRDSRSKLVESLKKTLSEEQVKQVEASMGGGGAMRARGPRPDGEGGGGGGGGGN